MTTLARFITRFNQSLLRHFIKQFIVSGGLVLFTLTALTFPAKSQLLYGTDKLKDASGTYSFPTNPSGTIISKTVPLDSIRYLSSFYDGQDVFYFYSQNGINPEALILGPIAPGKTYIINAFSPANSSFRSTTFTSSDMGGGKINCIWADTTFYSTDVGLSYHPNIPSIYNFTYTRQTLQLKLGPGSASDTAKAAFIGFFSTPPLSFSYHVTDTVSSGAYLHWYSQKYTVADSKGNLLDSINVIQTARGWGKDTLEQCPAVPAPGSYLAQLSLYVDSMLFIPPPGISFHFILTGPSFLFVDQPFGSLLPEDTIRNTSFIIYRASQIPGNDVLITTATTDGDGKIPIDTSKYHYGDTLRFEHFVASVPSIEHGAGGTPAYDIKFDNLRFDPIGTVLFDTLSHDTLQVIHIVHAFITLNPVVSIEWPAEQDFVDKTELDFRKIANYLYDVYDGQVQLGTVEIYDNRQDWTKADVRYYATTERIPVTGEGYINLPRRWTGSSPNSETRTILADDQWLNDFKMNNLNFRTVAHEMGHYYFNFKDEYKGTTVPHFRPGPLGSTNLGYMQSQYSGNGPYCSELSSVARYNQLQPIVQDVYKNMQWFYNRKSCWDQFAPLINNIILANTKIHCYILKPDERPLQTDSLYLPGPNDEYYDPGADYDVGSLVHFSIVAGAASKSVKYHFNFPSAGTDHAKAAKVELQSSASHPKISEGLTDNNGDFLLIGASVGDKVSAIACSIYPLPAHWGVLPDSSLTVERAISKHEGIASADTAIEVTMVPANGSYSFLPLCSWQSNGDLELGLAEAVPFVNVPSVTFSEPGSTDTNETMTFDNTLRSYSNRQSSPRLSSTVIVNATDSSNRQLPIFLDYSMTDSTLFPGSSNGKVQVILDSLNKTIQKFACISSDYPCPMYGLPNDAENMGSIHAISFFPPGVALRGNNELSIAYGDSAISHSQAEMQIFKWDSALRKWTQLGGSVDSTPEFKSVSVAIQSDGIYGIFATSVVSGVSSNNFPNNNGLVAFYDANTKTIRVNFNAGSDERASLEIYNILGMTVKSLSEQSFASGQQQLSVPAQELPSGVYFCMLKSEAGIRTAKIVIAR